MTSRSALAAILGALACPACSADPGSGGANALPDVENVVLVSIDTLRADHLGCYGNEVVRTPHLDALAAEGVLFTAHMNAAPSTLCSHTSLMTGTYPHTHGTPRNGFLVPEENEMLAEVLRDAGFVTAGFIGAYPLRSKFRFDQGFDTYDDKQAIRTGVKVNESVARWLENRPAGRLFLFVHYWDVHLPYDPPQPYRDMYRTDDVPMERTKDEIEYVRGSMQAGNDECARSGALKELYAGAVSFVDEIVGDLMVLLAQHELVDSSLIVVTSDHGEAMDEHWEFWDHGESTYDTTVRTPLILRLPSAYAAGMRRDEVVSNVDVMPSILELLDLPRSPALEGTSFVALLRSEVEAPRPPAFSEGTKPHDAKTESLAWTNARKCRAVRDGKWKLIERPLHGTLELYDLEADPGETTNLFEREKDAPWLAELRQRLGDWGSAVPSRTGAHDTSAETLRELEALGYVESE